MSTDVVAWANGASKILIPDSLTNSLNPVNELSPAK